MDLLRAMSATPGSYLSVSPLKLWAPGLLGRFSEASIPGEGNLYPGVVICGLAVLGIVLGWKRREPLRYGLIALVGVAMSFGPAVITIGSLKISTPYQLAYEYIPGLASLRFPLRYELVVLLGLGVLAAYGVAYLDTLLRRRTSSRVRHLAVAGIVLIAVADLLTVQAPLATIPTGPAVPPVYAWLRTQDASAVVAEIPNEYLARFRYVYFSAYHWHPLVNGVSGLNPPQYAEVSLQLDAFPRPDSVENLRSLGVRYLVAHRTDLDPNSVEQLDSADLRSLRMRIAAIFGSDVVYELSPRSEPSTVEGQARIELPSVIARNVAPAAALNVTNAGRYPLISVPGLTEFTFQLNGSAVHRRQALNLPLFLEPGDSIVRPLPMPMDTRTLADDRLEVSVDLNGPVNIKQSATVQLADLATSRQKTGLAGRLSRIQIPAVVHAGEHVPIRLLASNVGQAVWLAGADTGGVGVAVREWDDANGEPVSGLDGASLATSSHLDWNVGPGQSASVTLVATTPPQPGAYNLVLDMVSENVTVFDDVRGGARTVVPVVVQG